MTKTETDEARARADELYARRERCAHAALQGLLAGWASFYPHMTDENRLMKATAMAGQAAVLLHPECY